MCFLFLNLEEVSEIFHSGGKRDLDSLFRFLFSIIIFLWMYFHMEKIEDWGFWLLANQSKIVWANQSLQKNAVFFCDWKILDYAARLLKKCDEICGIFMQFYLMKLCLLAKIVGTCGKVQELAKNVFNLQKLRFDEKEGEKLIPPTPCSH